MAKKKTAKKAAVSSRKKVNKSQAIRDYRAKHPKAGPTEISKALTKQGIKVSPAHVSNVAPKSAKKKRTAKVGQRKAKMIADGESVRVADLLAAQRFVESVGGMESAKTLLSAIEKLAK